MIYLNAYSDNILVSASKCYRDRVLVLDLYRVGGLDSVHALLVDDDQDEDGGAHRHHGGRHDDGGHCQVVLATDTSLALELARDSALQLRLCHHCLPSSFYHAFMLRTAFSELQ